MMRTMTLSRLAGLMLTLALISMTCGWIPFTAPVTINSTPEGAEVYQAGGETPLGVTPFTTRVFLFDKQYEVRMTNCYTETVALNQDSPKEIHLSIRPKPVLIYTKPAADVYPAGSDSSLGKGSVTVQVLFEDRDYILKAKNYYDKELTINLTTENPQVIEMEHRPLFTISCVQDDVDVYENDTFISKTPVTLEILKPRAFELRKDGYYKKIVNMNQHRTHEIGYAREVKLQALPVITINASPSNAQIYMVGQNDPIGTGSAEVMIENDTGFEVKADRYYPKSINVEARTKTVKVSLDAMPYVKINSKPSGASISVDGNAIGTTPVEQLIEKPVSVQLTKQGYLPKTVTLNGKDLNPVIIMEKEPEQTQPQSQAQSQAQSLPVVTISSAPSGASVSVDGKVIGTTPLEQEIAKPIFAELTLDGYLSQTVAIDGINPSPMVTLQKKSFWQRLFGN